MKIKIILILFIVFNYSKAQSPLIFTKDNIPRKGLTKMKFGLHYDIGNEYLRGEVGLIRWNTFPKPGRIGDFSEIINHNLFISSEFNLNNKFILGPKVGYEFNYVFFSARVNFIDYFDFNGNNNLCFRPDLGFTFFGIISLTYGYNLQLYKPSYYLSDGHTISIIYNNLSY